MILSRRLRVTLTPCRDDGAPLRCLFHAILPLAFESILYDDFTDTTPPQRERPRHTPAAAMMAAATPPRH
jgi:hypothetical protein